MPAPNSSGPAAEIASCKRFRAEPSADLNRASVRWGEKARCSFAMPSGRREGSTAEASARNSAPTSTPAQNTLGRRSFGKNPTPRNFISIHFGGLQAEPAPVGAEKRIFASDALIASTFSGWTSPMNFNVRCTPSIRVHRTARLTGRSLATSAPRAARTSSGMSNATKIRTRSALRALLRLHCVKEIPPHQVERRLRGLPADAVALSGIPHAALLAAGRVGNRDVHCAHGFFRCAAGGTRHACYPDTERRACTAANAVGESDRDFGADCATRLDDLRGHIHPRGLERVAVGDDATQKISGTSRNPCKPFGQQPSGTALGRGDGRLMDRQLASHNLFHRFSFGGEHRLAQRQHDAFLDLLK